jgi:hypothetical protein
MADETPEEKTLGAARALSQAKRKLDKLTADLEACRTEEKRLLQEQARALNEFAAAKKKLAQEAVRE